MRNYLLASGMTLMLFSTPALQAKAPSSAAQKAIVTTIESALRAAATENTRGFEDEVASGFYMYDNGRRFDAQSIMALIKQVHASGTKLEWHVTEPDVHISGKTAWIAYVNQGSVTKDGAVAEKKWLESAFLVRTHEGWKIAFWHSSAAAAE
ncbi:nuclear transport factor 2 family protein [Silvibacterium sp.]|uniref:nuclear transport factor 2 family protein n=1 Tax=Silvibacterium sp. TaxID=1964179 RepID=UPI0039E3DDDD